MVLLIISMQVSVIHQTQHVLIILISTHFTVLAPAVTLPDLKPEEALL